MAVIRLTDKEGRIKHISEHVLDAKGADWWKSQGWAIDPKPYTRVITAKGVIYSLDKGAWEQQQKMHELAEGEPVASEDKPVIVDIPEQPASDNGTESKPPKKRTPRKKA